MKFRIIGSALIILGIFAVCASAFQTTTRSVREGVYTEQQRKRGDAAFQENCSVCHAQDLSGGEIAPALFGGNFMSNWNGLTVGDLSERIRQSMPPDNPDRMTQQQRVDIISLILNANGFPEGQKELETRVLLVEDRHAHDVRGQEIAGELDSPERAGERARQRAGERRLSHARYVLDQQVAAGEQRGQREADGLRLAPNHQRDVVLDATSGIML